MRKTLKLSTDLPFIGIHIFVVFWLTSQHKTHEPLLSHTGVICLIYFELIPDWSSRQIVSDLISINAFSKCPQQEGYSGFAKFSANIIAQVDYAQFYH